MHRITVLIFLVLLPILKAKSQEATPLEFEKFIEIVLKNHPVIRQINLLNDAANAQLMQAEGAFDPVIASNFAEKEFKGVPYYTGWDGYLKVPTWLGPDLKLGIDNRYGNFVNPEHFSPTGGLIYAGINVPLGQGIIIDERRAVLKQAKIALKLNKAQQQSLINKIIKDAAKDYWDWFFYYHQYKLYETGLILAQFRLKAINERIKYGDEAPIDSVEAKIEVQNRQMLLNIAKINYQNYRYIVSNYLWAENGTPLELKDNVIPSEKGCEHKQMAISDTLKARLTWAKTNHPDILKQQYKIDQLKVERLLNMEMLKPNININAGTLGIASPFNLSFNSSHFNNNYKIGMDLYVPIFLRKQRGKLKQTNIKIKEANYELDYISRTIENDIMIAFNELLNYEQLIPVQNENVKNSIMLRDAEQRKFENGESSLFLINTREQRLIESQIKLQKVKAEYAKAKVNFMIASGRFLPDGL